MKKFLFSLFALAFAFLAVSFLLPGETVLAEGSDSALLGASLYMDDQVDLVFCFDPDMIESKKAEGTAFFFTCSFDNKTYTEKDLVAQKDAISGKVYKTITVGPFKATERNTQLTVSGSMNYPTVFSLTKLAKNGIKVYSALPETEENERILTLLKAFVNYSVAVDNKVQGKKDPLPYLLSYSTPDFTADGGENTPLAPEKISQGRYLTLSEDVCIRYEGLLSEGDDISTWKINLNSIDVTDFAHLTAKDGKFSFTVPVHADQGEEKLRIIVRDGSDKVICDIIDRADALAVKLGEIAGYEELSAALATYLQAVSSYHNNPVLEERTFEEGKFYAGFGKADITPYCEKTALNTANVYSNEFLDPIYASCVALRDEKGTVSLLYSIDVRNIQSGRTEVYEKIKKSVSEATGVPGENIFFNATHNHSAPSVSSTDATVTAWYNNYFYPRIPLAAKRALQDLAVVEGAYTGTTVTGQGTNYIRRYVYDDTGLVIAYEDERDRELRTIRFDREGAKDILLVNWQAHAAHGAAVANKGSADFVGALRSKVEKDLGVHFLYINGASGDLNMYKYYSLDKNESAFTYKGYNHKGEWVTLYDYTAVGKSVADSVSSLAFSSSEKEVALGDIKIHAFDSEPLKFQYRKHLSDGEYCADQKCKECEGKYFALTYSASLSPKGATGYDQKGEYTDKNTGIVYQYYMDQNGNLIHSDAEVVENGVTYRRYKGFASKKRFDGCVNQVSTYSFKYQKERLNLSTLAIGDKIGFAFCSYEMFNQSGVRLRTNVKEILGSDVTVFTAGYTNGYDSYMATEKAFDKSEYGWMQKDDGAGEVASTKYVKGTAEYLADTLAESLIDLVK